MAGLRMTVQHEVSRFTRQFVQSVCVVNLICFAVISSDGTCTAEPTAAICILYSVRSQKI